MRHLERVRKRKRERERERAVEPYTVALAIYLTPALMLHVALNCFLSKHTARKRQGRIGGIKQFGTTIAIASLDL